MYKNSYTTTQLAKLLNVSQALVLKWLKEGKLKSIPLPSKRNKIPGPFIVEFLRKHNMPIPDELVEKPENRAKENARIVLIDDDEGVLRMVKSGLTYAPFPYDLFSFQSGIAALLEIESIRPHLCLLDLEMPDLDGSEVCGRLNEKYPDLHIVILSGHAEKEYTERLQGKRFESFVSKPIQVRAFLDTLERILLEKMS